MPSKLFAWNVTPSKLRLANNFTHLPPLSENQLAGAKISITDENDRIYCRASNGSNIALYSGSEWELMPFAELSLSTSELNADTNYDVFVFLANGALSIEVEPWLDDLTRQMPLDRYEGIWHKNGDISKRYVGWFRFA